VIQKGADAEIQGEVQQGFANAAGIGVLLMLTVLVLLLGNVFQPFSILLSLPLSLGGVVVALLLTRQAFSMPVIIGMLMLIGIVAKNAIMLVDFAVERKKHGMERVEAVIDAGLKRARPIVMTTIAMGAGMFPTALGIGEGGSFRSPMATAVIGGLIVSTFLSLIFVPSYFIIMDDLARLTGWIFGRFVGAVDEPKMVNAEVEDLRRDVARDVADVSGRLGQEMAQVTAEVSTQAGKLRALGDRVSDVDSRLESLRRSTTGKANLKLAAE
jgi:predicted RND superfamily exporter protein